MKGFRQENATRGAQRRRALTGSRLCLLFTPSLCVGDPWKTLRIALRAGLDFVQVREKEATSRELLALTQETMRIAAGRALVIVNDRADLAVLAGADGVHLGQDDLPAAAARRILGPHRLLGISTHSPQQAREAWKAGADLIGFGPIFPTSTKGYVKGIGQAEIPRVEREAKGPVFLIGGIRPERLAGLALCSFHSSCHRYAVSSAILQAPDPASATRNFLRFSLIS